MKRKGNLYKRIKSQRIRFSRCVLLLFLATFALIPFLPSAFAGGQDATFDSVDITALPPIQGVGGEINIQATANFFGGCCYHLYAFDVKAELKVPEFVRLVSPQPKTISEIDAIPGGKATSKYFNWKVVGDQPGVFELEIIVSSSNCGTITETYEITIVEGVSISFVNTHPKSVSVEDKITFWVDVKSGNEIFEIEKTNLYIWRSQKDFEHPEKELKAEENKVYEIIGELEDSKNQGNNSNTTTPGALSDKQKLKLLGMGEEYSMTHVEFTETWRTRIDDFGDEEFIYYWITVETSDGEIKTSPIVIKKQVEDLEKKYQMVNQAIWITSTFSVIGIILILGLSWSYYNRLSKRIDKSGIYVLGGTTFTKPTDGTRKNIAQVSLQRFRTLILFIFIILTIILLIASFYLGLFDELISATSG